MTPSDLSLARRWRAAPGFRWLPGMLVADWFPDEFESVSMGYGAMGLRNKECPDWPFAADYSGQRLSRGDVDDGIPGTAMRLVGPHDEVPVFDWLPDPTDPSAPGLALHMLREACGDPAAHISPFVHPNLQSLWWSAWVDGGSCSDWQAPTELAAIVAALEAQ